METKKTKLTISGKPRKNLYDNQGLTNNKNKQKFDTEKKFSKTFNKNNPGSSKFPKKTFSGKPSFQPKTGKSEYINALSYFNIGGEQKGCELLLQSINYGYSQAQTTYDQRCN